MKRVSKKAPARIIATKPADKNNVVHTIVGGGGGYCKRVCPQCPWRKDQTGSFPAEAFRHSAMTAYDMSQHAFACHMSGTDTPSTCAGFLLQGADDNLLVRMKRMSGEIEDDVESGGVALHASYKAMAVANGVPAGDPALAQCMPEFRDVREHGREAWIREAQKFNRIIRRK